MNNGVWNNETRRLIRRAVKITFNRIIPLGTVLIITTLIMHPSLWIGFLGLIIYVAFQLLIMGIVSRMVFKKSVIELLTKGLNVKIEEKASDEKEDEE